MKIKPLAHNSEAPAPIPQRSVSKQLIPVQFAAGLSAESIAVLKSCRMFTAMESDNAEERKVLADHIIKLAGSEQ